MFNGRLTLCISLGVALLGCGSSESDSEGGASSEPKQCEPHEPGTEFAPCETDADCYSGFCDETGNPGPYCWASSSAVAAGRGMACSSNEDCVVPNDAAPGVKGFCGGSNIADHFCSYVCKPDDPSSTGAGAASGSTTGSGA